MEIWLSNGVADKLQIPINPENIGYEDTRNFEDVVMASGKEKTIIGGRNLKVYSFSSYFAANPPTFSEVVTGPQLQPFEYVDKIKGWMDNKKVLQFQVTNTNINQPVTIRSFKWQENGITVGDVDYTLDLKEYDPITYSVVPMGSATVGVSVSARPASTATESLSRTYTVVRGDNLWNISKRYYGSGSKWPTIYNANLSIIGKNPNLIYPGQKLVIP